MGIVVDGAARSTQPHPHEPPPPQSILNPPHPNPTHCTQPQPHPSLPSWSPSWVRCRGRARSTSWRWGSRCWTCRRPCGRGTSTLRSNRCGCGCGWVLWGGVAVGGARVSGAEGALCCVVLWWLSGLDSLRWTLFLGGLSQQLSPSNCQPTHTHQITPPPPPPN